MIKKKSGKVVYENPWMEVHEDEVVFQNGHEGTYGVVHQDDFVLIIPFDGKRFHLVKQYRYAPQVYSTEFPQGKHEGKNKDSAKELAKAELAEETGFTTNSMEKIGFMLEAPGYSNQGFHIYLAKDLRPGEKSLDATEADLEHITMTENELEEAIINGEITNSPTVAAYGLLKLKKLI